MTATAGAARYRDRAGTIVALGLPIVGGMLSQNVLSLVDTAMVGTLGPTALAAEGIGSFANFMAMALVMGMSSSVQAMAARRKGEGREHETAVPLNGGLLLALVLGLPILIVLFVFGPALLPYINGDPAMVAESVPYFQARLCGILAVGMNFAFRGYWNGVSMSRVYLQVLLIMHTANVVLNYLLIFGALGIPPMGTLDAGIGSALATYIGAVGLVLMNALLGAGAARQAMLVTVSLQWLLGLPLTWLFGPAVPRVRPDGHLGLSIRLPRGPGGGALLSLAARPLVGDSRLVTGSRFEPAGSSADTR